MSLTQFQPFYNWPCMKMSYEITEADSLYRRFPISDEPKYSVFWKQDSNGNKIPSSAAFKTKPNENGLSVDIAALTTPEQTKGPNNNFGVAEIPASIPLQSGYSCNHDPLPDNNAHALIVGNTDKIAKKLSMSILRTY